MAQVPAPRQRASPQCTPHFALAGTGHYEFPDGSSYDGDWQDGLFDGEGVFVFAGTGDTYTGGFRAGQFHGQGKYEFANGDKYEGGFAGGRPAGRGLYVWAREDQSFEVRGRAGEWGSARAGLG